MIMWNWDHELGTWSNEYGERMTDEQYRAMQAPQEPVAPQADYGAAKALGQKLGVSQAFGNAFVRNDQERQLRAAMMDPAYHAMVAKPAGQLSAAERWFVSHPQDYGEYISRWKQGGEGWNAYSPEEYVASRGPNTGVDPALGARFQQEQSPEAQDARAPHRSQFLMESIKAGPGLAALGVLGFGAGAASGLWGGGASAAGSGAAAGAADAGMWAGIGGADAAAGAGAMGFTGEGLGALGAAGAAGGAEGLGALAGDPAWWGTAAADMAYADPIEAIVGAMEATGTETATAAAQALGYNSTNALLSAINPEWISAATPGNWLADMGPAQGQAGTTFNTEMPFGPQVAEAGTMSHEGLTAAEMQQLGVGKAASYAGSMLPNELTTRSALDSFSSMGNAKTAADAIKAGIGLFGAAAARPQTVKPNAISLDGRGTVGRGTEAYNQATAVEPDIAPNEYFDDSFQTSVRFGKQDRQQAPAEGIGAFSARPRAGAVAATSAARPGRTTTRIETGGIPAFRPGRGY